MRSLIIAVAVILTSTAQAQDVASGDIQVKQFDCGPTPPPVASVTDIATGLGERLISMDATADIIPPCGGAIPANPIIIGAFPLDQQIPQLAKIITDRFSCSAALIRANAVITAGHCVFPQDGSGFARSVTVIPGYQSGSGAYGRYQGIKVLTFRGWTASRMFGHDIAVIRFGGAPLAPAYNPYGLTAFTSKCSDPEKLYFRPHYNPAISNNEVQAQAEGENYRM